jgi:DNA modification methylase
MKYEQFIETKRKIGHQCGFEPGEINGQLFDFQRDIVRWALRKGRAAIFADCGLGKTPMQLEWAKHVSEHTGKSVLIFAPLAVSRQTKREGEKFGIHVDILNDGRGLSNCPVCVTNYEKLHKFDLSDLGGIVLDESSILKSFSGKFRTAITELAQCIPYRLACTATPAPNDYIELGNHSEFLGVKTGAQMLSMFFVHDSDGPGKWRLKGHAQDEYWRWMCSWAVMIRSPSDLGYDDGEFILPELRISQHTIKTGKTLPGELFPVEAQTLSERRIARRETLQERCEQAAAIANEVVASGSKCLLWCDLNAESALLTKLIDGAVEVKGADSDEHKTESMLSFAQPDGIRALVTKPKIAGFGMNWQACADMVFVGLSDSFEAYYQATRRCWRFGQERPVGVHIVTAEEEGAVVKNIERKESDALRMAVSMVDAMSDLSKAEIGGTMKSGDDYTTRDCVGDDWRMINGDSAVELGTMSDCTIDYTIYSPPFAELFTYSDLERDLGNSADYDEFFEHYSYIVRELFRVSKPGRLTSIHCIDIPAMKERDGYIGLKDFPGDIIKAYQAAGWIYHSRVTIWKNPLIEATRTKALGLMHKQLCKDSAMCRQGLPDYIITMRKPGDNAAPISHGDGFQRFVGDDEPTQTGIKYSHEVWRRYASPVWMDISQTRTLNVQVARDDRDEKHICPLQLDTIERCLELWSNPGDLVLSPFAGIGSEGYVCMQTGRRFIGIELKPRYYDVACDNLKSAKRAKKANLLSLMEDKDEE